MATFDNWRDAVAVMKASLRPVTVEQHELAKSAGIKLNKRLPKQVAAAKLRHVLRDPLGAAEPLDPSEGQQEFLRDLEEHLGRRPVNVATREEASAWIDVLSLQRSVRALTELRLRRGDVVTYRGEVETVSSIGDNGTVYFGRGRQAPPHRVEVLARVDDRSSAADDLRAQARHSRVSREGSGPPRTSQLRMLAPFQVSQTAGNDEAELISALLDDATDERPLQRVLAENPSCLATLVRSTYGTFVRPLPRLGSQYVPDFAIAHADSIGIHWLLVELESPAKPLSTQAGDASQELRKAMRQIADWRDWLVDNIDYARRSPDENGLGLAGIDGSATALILIGTAEEHHPAFQRFRRRTILESATTIHTYSWLVRTLRRPHHPLIGPLDLEAASDF